MSRTNLLSDIIALILVALVPSVIGADAAPSSSSEDLGISDVVSLHETNFEVTERYTAQRKPRVTVLSFEDTNSAARSASYGSSIEAMLVTFLKRKSQLIVVERQKLGKVIEEWQRIEMGQTNIEPEEQEAPLLQKIDAIILGNVTLLGMTAEARVAPSFVESGESGNVRRGQRIEIDAKLLSRRDGRIIAAAQRSGPVTCLRSIVERLGVALEQAFLQPYFGKLQFKLSEPENVRILLTPIVSANALDEEKPPIERSSTVILETHQDLIEPWTTDPTTYTIENILSGWYSLRLSRSGYEIEDTDNDRWEVRQRYGNLEVFDRLDDKWLDEVDPDAQRFLVRVDPLTFEKVDGDLRGFAYGEENGFHKRGGSIAPRIKRQFLDDTYVESPNMQTLLVGNDGLEINSLHELDEYADDETCDLFAEQSPNRIDYGTTLIASGQEFSFDTFKGGKLVIEDYNKGLVLPVGDYEMFVWEPYYTLHPSRISVRYKDSEKPVSSSLNRETDSIWLSTTGKSPRHSVVLQGVTTGHRRSIDLDFDPPYEQKGVPVDQYRAATDVPGLTGWSEELDLLRGRPSNPIYDPAKESGPPVRFSEAAVRTPDLLRVKTRLCVSGRLDVFTTELPDNTYCSDPLVPLVLDVLLSPRNDEEPVRFLASLKIRLGLGMKFLSGTHYRPAKAAVAELENQAEEADASQATSAASADVAASGGKDGGHSFNPDLDADAEELRGILRELLELTDLLVLDNEDMAGLRREPGVSRIVRDYVEAGGALLAFVSDAGDYGFVGSPLVVEAKDKQINRLTLAGGEVSGFDVEFRGKKVKTKSKRALPQLKGFERAGAWRVLAFTKGRKDPRMVERGIRDDGGYVTIWADDPASFLGRKGGTVPEIEKARSKLEERALAWARYLMYRRLDDEGTEKARAEQAL